MRKLMIALLIALGIALRPATAFGGAITLNTEFNGASVGHFFRGYILSGDIPDGRAAIVPLGSVSMTASGADLGSLDGLTFEAYCVDILGPVFEQPVPYTVNATVKSMADWDRYEPPNMPADAGAKAAYLYNTYAGAIAASDPALSDPAANIKRAALQMAIWNALYDNDFSVSNGAGDFYVWNDPNAGSVVTTANAYLATLEAVVLAGAGLGDAAWLQLDTLSGDAHQDFMGPRAATVPEPSSALLFGAGFAVATLHRRSRRRAGVIVTPRA